MTRESGATRRASYVVRPEAVRPVRPPGTSVVYTTPLYGGTQHLIHQLLEPLGIDCIAVPGNETAALVRAVERAKGLRLVFIETPANPTLQMVDIGAAVAAVEAVRARVE